MGAGPIEAVCQSGPDGTLSTRRTRSCQLHGGAGFAGRAARQRPVAWTSPPSTPDGSLANGRAWARLGDAAAPDGIYLDAEGAVWYADVPNQQCVRVREGGEVLQIARYRAGAACSVPSAVPGVRTLLMVVADWSQGPAMFTGDPYDPDPDAVRPVPALRA